MSPKFVFCVAPAPSQAERIAHQLKIASFSNHAITLLLPDADTAHGSTRVLLAVVTANTDEVSRAKTIFTAAGAGDICTSGVAAPPRALAFTVPLRPPTSSVRYPCPA